MISLSVVILMAFLFQRFRPKAGILQRMIIIHHRLNLMVMCNWQKKHGFAH